MSPSENRRPEAEIIESLRAHGLLNDAKGARFEALTGGISSDIWKVEADGRVYCVKRALAKLKVKANWFAPVERNRYEVEWYRRANQYVPGSAPRVLAHDESSMLFAMEYLDPRSHKLWKPELKEGRAKVKDARMAGEILGKIHSGAAKDKTLQNSFPPNDIFHAIRLEPYLEATAIKHADLREQLFFLSRRTNQTQLTMIHGDVSPKNMLFGPNGPIFLDAECACIGDPAFDLAFCLNHFLLKCLWTPSAKMAFIDCFNAMALSYMDFVDWEAPADLEARTASLLPGLFLARIDGKSPIEYVSKVEDKAKVRRCARGFLFSPSMALSDIATAWREEIST
jgi:aminoglycoside phosphotransferase (APT) family kinase protein